MEYKKVYRIEISKMTGIFFDTYYWELSLVKKFTEGRKEVVVPALVYDIALTRNGAIRQAKKAIENNKRLVNPEIIEVD